MRYLLDTALFANNATMPQVLPARILKLVDTDEKKEFAASLSSSSQF